MNPPDRKLGPVQVNDSNWGDAEEVSALMASVISPRRTWAPRPASAPFSTRSVSASTAKARMLLVSVASMDGVSSSSRCRHPR